MNNQAILHKCRPVTATLTRPQVLDPSWSLNIDMTEISLSDVESLLSKPSKGSIKGSTLHKYKKKFITVSGDSKRTRRTGTVPGPLNSVRVPTFSAMDILSEDVTNRVPSPCRTCSKNDEPERFHSHPKTTNKNAVSPKEDTSSSTTPRSTVTKPVALKFKSGKAGRQRSPSQTAATELPATKKPASNTSETKSKKPSSLFKTALPCNKCGREISAYRLPAHERICRGKSVEVDSFDTTISAYEENQMFCKRCGKTFSSMEALEAHVTTCAVDWNDLDVITDDEQTESGSWSFIIGNEQYENYKQQLKPCPICKRKFVPNRIATHEAACRKMNHSNLKAS